MILFLIPVPGNTGGYYFDTLASYFENPFEKDSILDRIAQEILHHGITLHVGPYEDFEQAVEQLEMFQGWVRKELSVAIKNDEAFGPAHVYTKGFTTEQICALLDIMPTKAPHCVLALKIGMPPGSTDTVNPYGMNKLE
jgi:hypothetical protein